MEFSQTISFIKDLISKGIEFFSDIKDKQRRSLISVYICEIDKMDALFDGYQPSRFLISSLLEKPKSEELRERIIDEITDCIYSSHELRLEELFDEALIQYKQENPDYVKKMYEYEEWEITDNRDRYLDVNYL